MNILDYLLVTLIGFCSTSIFLSGQRIYNNSKKIIGICFCILGIFLGLFMLLFSAIPTIIGSILCFIFQYEAKAPASENTSTPHDINKANKTVPEEIIKSNSTVNSIASSSSDTPSKLPEPIKVKSTQPEAKTKPNYPLFKLKIHKKRKTLQNYIVVDIETTGLVAPLDKVIQLSALKIIDGKIVDSFDTYVNPGKDNLPLTPFIEELTHIHTSNLNGAPMFEEIKEKFLDFAGDLPWVGHNIVKFDIPFLYQSGLGPEEYWAADTYLLAKRKLNRYILGNLKLSTLKEYYHIKEPSHNSLSDCRTDYIIYQHFVKADCKI